ncbi:MAG: sensor histidine kinase, partial [Cyclobacteriaceae bacterium]
NKSKEVESYLKMMTTSVKQQDKFIHDILDISKNARLEVKNEEIDFEVMVNEVFDQIKFLNHTRVTRKIEIQKTDPFFSDVSRLRVIFNNLISNSIRYHNGKQPKVEVSVRSNRDTANILVKDNGIGIASEHLKKVFKMFYRATETNPGSGLGLYIVKESIEKLNGSVRIDSQEGNGTEVLIEIPNRIDDQT